MAQVVVSRNPQKLSQMGLAGAEASGYFSKACPALPANTGTKRKRGLATESSDDRLIKIQSTSAKKVTFAATAATAATASPSPECEADKEASPTQASQPVVANTSQPSDLTPYLKKIALSHITPFQKRVLTALCQVPPGQYTTYGVLSKHLSSSPRAVGNALRNNPFAPQVPCHRVLASGGGLGGFEGSWGRGGEKGKNDDKKRGLLRDEGVLFNPKGLVVGKVWEGFN
ncbi:uncharacterized protein BP5553_05846 [Venustampulla echinocandica]|uniref:Methylated-DNA--protein-cysteine methyltransferase n=1 Tax=Venustampulla echinocandica TaxID=2656787 RepID=A0A370TLV0_9HELO|nr:uncharacterized protein BP5553_05846 [Venustampulla echinocandica]RDL36494.1 hypothetical protein BP5553_05846 [Venustampulla echinocandica]